MRHILLVLLGIVIGTMATISLNRAISQRNPVPRAVMVMMAYHQGQLSRIVRSGHCDAASLAPHWPALQAAAADITPVFEGFDTGFAQAAQALQQSIQQAATQPVSRCQQRQLQLADIKARCDACHRQYR